MKPKKQQDINDDAIIFGSDDDCSISELLIGGGRFYLFENGIQFEDGRTYGSTDPKSRGDLVAPIKRPKIQPN